MRLIDADKLLSAHFLPDNMHTTNLVLMHADEIRNMPTIDPVRHGEWVFADEWADIGKVIDLLRKFDMDPLDADIESIYCSCCGKGFNVCDNQDTDEFEYCPHCGAKMDGEPE